MRKYISLVLLVVGAMYITSCTSCSDKRNSKNQRHSEYDELNDPSLKSEEKSTEQRTVIKGKDITDNKQYCSTCEGTGKVNGKKCKVCFGYGYILVYK